MYSSTAHRFFCGCNNIKRCSGRQGSKKIWFPHIFLQQSTTAGSMLLNWKKIQLGKHELDCLGVITLIYFVALVCVLFLFNLQSFLSTDSSFSPRLRPHRCLPGRTGDIWTMFSEHDKHEYFNNWELTLKCFQTITFAKNITFKFISWLRKNTGGFF